MQMITDIFQAIISDLYFWCAIVGGIVAIIFVTIASIIIYLVKLATSDKNKWRN